MNTILILGALAIIFMLGATGVLMPSKDVRARHNAIKEEQ